MPNINTPTVMPSKVTFVWASLLAAVGVYILPVLFLLIFFFTVVVPSGESGEGFIIFFTAFLLSFLIVGPILFVGIQLITSILWQYQRLSVVNSYIINFIVSLLLILLLPDDLVDPTDFFYVFPPIFACFSVGIWIWWKSARYQNEELN